MPLILGAASATGAAAVVTNSCRFNKGDSPTLTKTQVAGSRTKATFSVWVKRSDLSEDVLYTQFANGTNFTRFRFSSDTINANDRTSGAENWYFTTNAVYRDPGAWYHVVVAIDTTQVTDTDRLKCYVNGVLQTFASQSYPTKDANMNMNQTGDTTQVGADELPADYFDGYLAEVVWIDGTQYAASDFGEFDEDSPTIWKPKDVSGLTFGNNGFYLDFEDSANLGNDANGGTDLTENNIVALDQCVDTPVNNFCTINSLDSYYQSSTYSEGNCKVVTESGSAVYAFNTGTMGLTAGKWYWEMKYTNSTAGGALFYGAAGQLAASTSDELGQTAQQLGFLNNNTTRTNNTATAFGDTGGFTTGDVMMCALDMTNSRIFFGKDGVWMTPAATSGGDPTDGTGAVALPTAVASTAIGAYMPAFGPYVNASQTYEANFGNPSFSITSEQNDENGYGKFEYTPPTGFLAVCTKNLATDGG